VTKLSRCSRKEKRPSLIMEHHSVPSISDLAREASLSSTLLRRGRQTYATDSVGGFSLRSRSLMRLRGRVLAKLIRNLSDPNRLSCSLTKAASSSICGWPVGKRLTPWPLLTEQPVSPVPLRLSGGENARKTISSLALRKHQRPGMNRGTILCRIVRSEGNGCKVPLARCDP